MQSGPGSLVSAILITSLSPVCGLEVFTTPTPQSIWSTREQSPPRMFTKKVGTMKPGWSQHPCVPRGTQPFGLPATSHPGTPAHDACGFPHGTHALCSQVGKVPGVTVKFVCTPVANGITCPSAVTHGSWRHAPAVLPQSASVVQVPKRFAAELVVAAVVVVVATVVVVVAAVVVVDAAVVVVVATVVVVDAAVVVVVDATVVVVDATVVVVDATVVVVVATVVVVVATVVVVVA